MILRRNKKDRIFNVPDRILLKFDHFIVHCSATPPSADWDASDIDRVHRERGWSGGGYNVVITRNGTIQAHKLGHLCRPLSRSGAHVGDCGPGWNTRSLGVCLIGGIDEEGRPSQNFTRQQYAALEWVIKSFYRAHPQPWNLKFMGHRDLIALNGAPPKACPSFDVREWARRAKVFEDFDFQGDREDLNHAGQGNAALPATHTIVAGDTYWGLSNRYGISVSDLKRMNGFRSDGLRIGTVMRLR